MRWWIAVAGSAVAVFALWRPIADGDVGIAVFDAVAGATFVAVGALRFGCPDEDGFIIDQWLGSNFVEMFAQLGR